MFSRRASWISVFHHPFLLGSGCFLFILYKLFPSLVVFLVKSSPVIACTALLLGIVLLYGEPNIPESKRRDQKAIRIKNKERTKENNGVKRRKNKGTTSKSREHSDVEQVVAGTVASCSSVAAHNRRKKTKYREHSADRAHQGLTKANRNIGHQISDKRRIPALRLNIERCNFDKCFDSTVGSPWQHVNHHDASSDSESENVESSSASDTDAIPVLHELGAPQSALVSCYNSDEADSGTVRQDLELDDDSIDEESESQDDDDEDDDDSEAKREKEEDDKAVVTWTADDQRTLVHLGNSELERNHKVENLIAMRRAWRSLRHEKQRNLPNAEEESRFNIQLPSIYAPRSNPFDLPFDSEDIPGSAPSVLLPRRNPFDLPYDQVEQNSTVVVGNLNHHEVIAPPVRDMLCRRHESFTIGAPFFGDPNHDRRNYRFRPFFAAEKMMEEERVPTDIESRAASSLSDHEHRRNLQEIGSATDHDVDFIDRASKSSEEAESAVKVQLVDDDYESNSSVQPEADGNCSKVQISEQATSRGLALSHSSRGIVPPSRVLGKKIGHVPENHIVDPAYDSSSSARSLSNVSPKGSSEEGPSVDDVLWVAPSLASIDQLESTSREISVIKETDVIGDKLCKVHQGFGGGGIVPALPELAARQSLLYSMSGLSSGRRPSAGS